MVNLPSIRVSSAQVTEVSRKVAEALREPPYPYPWWKTLEPELNRKGLSSISIVAYGSLLNSASAAKTFWGRPLGPRDPVIAFGARRIFNYQMSSGGGQYGPPTRPLARAALNTRITGNINDALNGVLLEISVGEIRAMQAREKGYDLLRVACLRWNAIEEPPFLAYILRCPDEPQSGRKRTNDELEPHREYYWRCRRGAGELGEEFLRFWLSTTYLADGVTPVAQWEASEFSDMRELGTSGSRP